MREPPGIRRVAVIGAGTMGGGIAQAAAQSGFEVRLADAAAGAAERALSGIGARLRKGVELGKVAPEAVEAALGRIRLERSVGSAAAGADLVIEAVPEELELKRSLFREVAAAAAPGALLATNTSSISIAKIASAADPARTLGLHFFNPVHVMSLVEVVTTPELAPGALAAAHAFVAALGKEAVTVRDSPGFATSRLGIALGMEAIRMLEEGVASAPDIDRAMELGYRHPMGPLRLTDLVGLDVRLHIAENLHRELRSDTFRPPQLLRRLVDEGRLGQKTGRGFYVWKDGKSVEPAPLEPAESAPGRAATRGLKDDVPAR
ncbi:MAG: 3-hydroxyacyl-CoA dehydrogenase family protein [Candidatus Rokubacteria bacterium]|nr:3-hydroxyacyl-CoA dehydrogenase family protein [Candidatus Rokubacteria bacterium]